MNSNRYSISPGAGGEGDDDDSDAESKPKLEPLPVLEGYVPEGWKDAVYAEN
jgi:hypothetical protein